MRILAKTALVAAFLPSVAHAQVQLTNKWDSGTRTLAVDLQLPVMCDDPLYNARNYLQSVEPAMSLPISFVSYSPSQSTSTISFTQQGYGGTVSAGTTAKSYMDPDYFWESYGQLVDADIFMNYDLLFWPGTTDTQRSYDLFCSSQYQTPTSWNYDYQSAILHELGHLVGFEHRTDAATGPCLMHSSLPRGLTADRLRRAFCSDERAAYTAAY